MNKQRPVNLDLRKFHFPLPAITSILHRVSGILIFIGMAFLLYWLDLSLSGEEGFAEVRSIMEGFFARLVAWGILSALAYHLVAGVRHILMDAGIGESLEGGRLGAKLVIAISVVLIVLLGVWIW
ncbi:MAG: succinate dehydrogenase, cytochrome b556 subunit [Pseudohongiellaceae bacterium]